MVRKIHSYGLLCYEFPQSGRPAGNCCLCQGEKCLNYGGMNVLPNVVPSRFNESHHRKPEVT